METLTLVPIEDSVVFPGMTATLALEVGEEERVFLVPRSDERVRLRGHRGPGRRAAADPRRRHAPSTLEGLHRGVAGAAARRHRRRRCGSR